MNFTDAINALTAPDSISFATRNMMIDLLPHAADETNHLDRIIADALDCMIDYDALNALPTLRIRYAAQLHIIAEMLIFAETHERDELTQFALSNSICPIHFHDYAICFDDASCYADDQCDEFAYTTECDSIRLIHPTHDT